MQSPSPGGDRCRGQDALRQRLRKQPHCRHGSAGAQPPDIIAERKQQEPIITSWKLIERATRLTQGKFLYSIGSGAIGLRDGPAAEAQFNRPQGVAVDSGRGLLYVAVRRTFLCFIVAGQQITSRSLPVLVIVS